MRSFKLESLYLDLKSKQLKINGKEIALDGITDFSLTADSAGWHLSGKRSIIPEICEETPAKAENIIRDAIEETFNNLASKSDTFEE